MYLSLCHQMLKNIYQFAVLELKLEFRLKFALAALLMYVLSTVYLIYFSVEYQGAKSSLDNTMWSILFWLIILFTTVNACFRSLSKENDGRMFFYYTLLNPKTFILGKMAVNAFISLLLSLISALVFSIVLGNAAHNYWVYFAGIALGTVGYALLFTYVSAIAVKAGSNAVLSVVLGFPISIPLLTIIVKLFSESFLATLSLNFYNNLFIAVAFIFMPLLLAVILFPYIWHD